MHSSRSEQGWPPLMPTVDTSGTTAVYDAGAAACRLPFCKAQAATATDRGPRHCSDNVAAVVAVTAEVHCLLLVAGKQLMGTPLMGVVLSTSVTLGLAGM
jgi:hypothetical protein